MDHLSKQQLILLALLVSFMTSLATGIVTVSLMDQAPSGVTRTVSQVIEKTIQQVSAPESVAVGTVTLSVKDQLANAVASVSPSVVKIEDMRANNIVGLGLVVSREGMIMTDRSIIVPFSSYEAVMSDGTTVPMTIMSTNTVSSQTNNVQTNNDVVFLQPSSNISGASGTVFTPIDPATSFTLGQSVFSLAGTSTAILGQGVITDMASSSASTSSLANAPSPIGTSIPTVKTSLGGPLFDIQGKIIGVRTSSMSISASDPSASAFESVAPLLSAIPVIK